MKSIKTIFFSLAAFVLLISLDQFSKYIIRQRGGFYICNPNIAFGIEIRPILFWIFWGIIIMVVFWRLKKEASCGNEWAGTLHITALLLILAGALSNMIDRIALGCVTDFIDLKTYLPVDMAWPVFNLADMFIVIGAVLSLVKMKKI